MSHLRTITHPPIARPSQVEHLVPPTDHHNTTGQVLQSIHGHKRPVNITVANSALPDDAYVIASSHELSGGFGYNVDMNSVNPLGIGMLSSSLWPESNQDRLTSFVEL